MIARPTLFSGPMIRALRDGRKSQTRRICNPQPQLSSHHEPVRAESRGGGAWVFMVHTDRPSYAFATGDMRCPYGQAGDLLWVRESHSFLLESLSGGAAPVWCWADGNPPEGDYDKIRPSIHMPRWASRLTLKITEVRVERLQSISSADAIAEGIAPSANVTTIDCATPDPRLEYASLWDSLNFKRGFGWGLNPWVWVLTFNVEKRNVDDVLSDAKAAA
jgi:hypothetical protein